jgi:hypothetical protein
LLCNLWHRFSFTISANNTLYESFISKFTIKINKQYYLCILKLLHVIEERIDQ